MNKLFLISLLWALSFSQVASDYVYTGAEATALAGAVVANPGSEASLFHNPAALAEIDRRFATVGSTRLFDVDYNYLGFLLPTPWLGNLGFTWQQSATKAGGTTLSEERSLGISGGYFLQQDRNSSFMVGYTLNFLNWSLGPTAGISGDGSDGLPGASGSTVGVDVGLQAVLRGKHRVGAYLKNINSPVMGKGESQQNLPRRISVGVSYTPLKSLVTSLTVDKPLARDIEVKGGVAYNFNSSLTLRLGLQSNPNRMGAGLSLNFSGFNFDYGLLTHPVLPATQQFTLGWKF
ncbi:MAG: hypothetical protein GXO91_01210 [FCB group bacterium]|nr:hypothetical protein [FCB group bacterium]